MYHSLTEFMQNLSADNSLLWALLVMGVVAATGLLLYAFWEVVLGLVVTRRFLKKIRRRPTE